MKKLIHLSTALFLSSFLSVFLSVFLLSTNGWTAECGIVSDTFNLDLPCASYNGTNYRIQLDYNYFDGTNVYFKLKSVTQSTSSEPCASVDSDLNISVSCIDLSGTKLSLALALYDNPKDRNWPYWELIGWSGTNDGANHKPVANSISLNVDSTIPYIEQQLSASDPDGDILTYELISDSSGTGYSAAYINPGTGMLYLTHEPTGNDSFSISYRVTDGQLFSDPATLNVHVTYLSDDTKDTGRKDVSPDDYATFKLSAYNSDLLGTKGDNPSQPGSIDLSANFPTPGDQGRQSSCIGWATAYALKSYQEKVEIGWPLNTSSHLFSPAFIYNQINNGQDHGGYINDALDLIVQKGIATLDLMPYSDSNYTTQPSRAALAEASEYKAANWFRVNDTSQIKAALVNRKPVVCGITVYPQLMELKGPDSVYNTATGQNQGGHAVTIVGYDDNRYGGAFKVINSWSQNWGDNGFFWMPYNFAASGILSEAYVLEDAENGTKPTPEDPTEPKPDQNTLPDLTIQSWNITYDPRPRGKGALTYTIVNTGAGIAKAGANINLMLSSNNEITTNDYYVVYETIPFDLNQGESAYRDEANSIAFQFPDQLQPGTYYIGLWVDDQNVITESNENNNISISGDLVSITNSLPDLSVNTWYADWDNYGNGTLTYEVINNGASSTTTMDWDINLVLDKDQVIGNGNEIILFYENASYLLKPGEYIYRNSQNPAYFNLKNNAFGFPVPSGVYFMALWVDDLNMENESNELNNGSYSWGTVPIQQGYGALAATNTETYGKTDNAQDTARQGDSTSKTMLTGKAYNGKKLPPKNLLMRKVQITRDASGKIGMSFIGKAQNTAQKKCSQTILPDKKICSKADLIFPIIKRIPMPGTGNTYEK